MKRVIKGHGSDTVLLEDTRSSKIYVVKSDSTHSIYKLHQIENVWMFCDMGNSNCGFSGVHRSMYQAIDEAMKDGDVYEFDNMLKFLDWVRSNT